MAIAESVDEEAAYIGSASGVGGLRKAIARRIGNPERYRSPAEKTLANAPDGWHGVVMWAELPSAQSATDHKAALVKAHEARHGYKPSFRGSPGNKQAGEVKGKVGALAWSGFHAMHASSLPNFPTEPGVYLIAAVCEAIPVMALDGEERWVNVRRDANRVPSIGPPPRKAIPIIYGHESDHDWIRQVRRERARRPREAAENGETPA